MHDVSCIPLKIPNAQKNRHSPGVTIREFYSRLRFSDTVKLSEGEMIDPKSCTRFFDELRSPSRTGYKYELHLLSVVLISITFSLSSLATS